MQLIVLVVLLALAWGFVILPQQRRVKAHRSFVASLAVGDEVITTAGLYATITELSEERARIRIAPDVEVTIARLAIGRSARSDVPSQDAPPEDVPADGSVTDDTSE